MKLLKIAIAAVFALGASNAYAFHSGGVAECGGCHSMHAAQDAESLLVAADPSSTCFSCHMNANDTGPSSYHVGSYITSMNTSGGGYPLQRSPGGDFSWLLITKSSTVRGSVENYYGYKNGHNIVAAAQGFAADPANATAPGGTMSSAALSCISCHDQHGQARRELNDVIKTGGSATGLPIGNSGSYNTSADPTTNYAVGIYRLLRASGGFGGFPGAPVAVAPATYNKQENGTIGQVRVVYGTSGIGTGNASWGAWCGSCHGGMLATTAADHSHPVDVALGDKATNYNDYIKSGWTGGVQASAFTSLVPFATRGTGFTSYSSLKPLAEVATNQTNRSGPETTDQVMCLSCHRAHASAFPEMTRFGLDNEFVTDAAAAYKPILGRDALVGMVASYNGRAANNILVGASVSDVYAQRVLCNKCHLKD